MSMNDTPESSRIHISLFGKRNAGKSSVMNALLGQELSIVSEVKGTTTDPVRKAMELLPLGPVLFTDTPGLDDEGPLGNSRVKKSYEILQQTDIALVIVDAALGRTSEDEQMIARLRERKIPYIVVYNKQDLLPQEKMKQMDTEKLSDLAARLSIGEEVSIWVSAVRGFHIRELKELLAGIQLERSGQLPIIADLVRPKDMVVLVVPVDKAAPKGRLILPQQQTIRELLDIGAVPVVTRERELEYTLEQLGERTKLVVTDSQVFELVAKLVPERIPLTSFSILFARHKGVLQQAVAGAEALAGLKPGDRILIAEGCTHHRQCGDIGTQKLPAWIRRYSGSEELQFEFTSGAEFPKDVTSYQLIIQCGGCMLKEQEVRSRYQRAKEQGVPITNYGIAISEMKGILKRSICMLSTVFQYDKKENRDAIYTLWQSTFHDLDSFADYYFQWVYSKNQVLVARQGNRIISMLHLNPYLWIWQSARQSIRLQLHYIVGVATEEDYRRQGLMRRCMERALQDLAKAGEPFTYLMPAKKEYYEPFQFVTLTEERRSRIDRTGWKPDIDEEQCGRSFPIRDAEYKARLQAEVQSEGGDLLEWGDGTGYCAYVLRREQEKIKIIIEQFFCPTGKRSVVWRENIEPELYRRYGDICIEEEADKVERSPEGGLHQSRGAVGNYKNMEIEYISAQTMMIRVLNAEQFVELLPYEGESKCLLVNLSDVICAKNNGKFLLSLSADGCGLIRYQDDEEIEEQIPAVNWDILQLTAFLLEESRLAESIYLMEIV